jgi:hypothetical protein
MIAQLCLKYVINSVVDLALGMIFVDEVSTYPISLFVIQDVRFRK